MNGVKFPVVSGTDNDYWEAFKLACADLGQKPAQVTFGYLSDGELLIQQGSDPDANQQLRTILDQHAKLFKSFNLKLDNNRSVTIARNLDAAFDSVTCNPIDSNDKDTTAMALLIGATQRRFGGRGLKLNPILTEERETFYRVQEAAIQQLTTAIATAGRDLEETRKRLNAEFEEREKKLLDVYEVKNNQLDHKYEAKDAQLEQKQLKASEELEAKKKELEEQRKKLDDRNATHARREKQTEIDTLLESLEREFKVSPGTTKKGVVVVVVTIIAIICSAASAGYFLTHLGTAGADAGYVEWFALISNAIKAVVFTAITISLSVYLIRWMNDWFQRHAQEEFRLKRLRVDVKRSIWFVETAREWTDTKGSAMPNELINRLTANLFVDLAHEGQTEQPMDALAQVLLGGSKINVKFPSGSAEIDRKGLQQIQKGDD